MKSYKLIICSIVLIITCATLTAQSKQVLTYKTVGGVSLQMDVYTPTTIKSADKAPAIIFFFGGGWNTGNRTQFKYFAELYATKGIVTILADYRIKSLHQTTPIESLKDAKSAIRYIKLHAEVLHIDTTRIIASGGSAGGQLAAACFTNETINEDTDDLTVSAKPKFLVLFNPVVDNSVNGYGYEAIGDLWEEVSPMHNVKAPFVPTIFLVGTKDKIVPVATAQAFKQKIEQVGGRCDLILYTGLNHGFFNKDENRPQVVQDVDAFLESIGCLKSETAIRTPYAEEQIPLLIEKNRLSLKINLQTDFVRVFAMDGSLAALLTYSRPSVYLDAGNYIAQCVYNNRAIHKKILII